MTTSLLRSLQTMCVFGIASLLFSGCLKDTCKQTYMYKIYKPVYLSYEELRSSVKSLPSTDLKEVGKIYYKAPYIFVNELNKGIHVIDNSDPSSPQNIGFINIPGNVDMAIEGNILYADSYIDLVALDITSPLVAKEVSRQQNVFPDRVYTNGWTGDASKGVITDWIEADTLIEQDCALQYPIYFDSFFTGGMQTTNSSGGTSTGNMVTPGPGLAGSMARFAIYSNYLYCLDNASMKLFDITNASSPIQGTTVNMPWNIETIFPYSHYLFIGSTTGVSIYDNSNPSSPSLVSQLVHVTSCDPVVVQGNYAYATLHDGSTCQGFSNELDIIDISDIQHPQLKNTISLSHPYGLGIDGSNLFICDDQSGLKLFNASDALHPSLKQTVDAGETRDVIPVDDLLLMVSADGLYQYDYSSGSLQQLSILPFTK